MSERGWDVLVIGAGPAGSTAAALLAERGHRVLVLEKEEFPRFHIGESLLPASLPVLERLGVPARADTFVFKRGAEFVCEASGRAQRFAFSEAQPGGPGAAWHVDRARFDTVLRDRARALGAEVRHGTTVLRAHVGADAVTVETRSGTVRGRYLVDASGQSRLLARQAGAAVPYTRFGHAAAFTHFADVSDAAWQELGPGFEIRVMLRPEGWGWIIPLPDRRLSIGMAAQGRIGRAELDAGLLQGPLVRRLTRGARRLADHVAGNYSYRNRAPIGARFAAVGDAACFLDPVFSSGVTLALHGAAALADRLGPALCAGEEGRPDLLAEHQAAMDRATQTFAALIDRFYNSRFADTMLLADPGSQPLRPGVTSVLAGDVWRAGNAFQDLLLKARRHVGQADG
jgi:flavin-dependent dehydrogenase